jgi:hypothetical protein
MRPGEPSARSSSAAESITSRRTPRALDILRQERGDMGRLQVLARQHHQTELSRRLGRTQVHPEHAGFLPELCCTLHESEE